MAWGLRRNLAATAIPLSPEDLKAPPITVPDYLERLAYRVMWLVSREDDPEEAADLLERQAEAEGLVQISSSGADPEQRAWELVVGNPGFRSLFEAATDLPVGPLRLFRVQQAVAAIKETSLEAWVLAAFPGHSTD
jgi:hypothetical protein